MMKNLMPFLPEKKIVALLNKFLLFGENLNSGQKGFR
jgi:hypothetical protein